MVLRQKLKCDAFRIMPVHLRFLMFANIQYVIKVQRQDIIHELICLFVYI